MATLKDIAHLIGKDLDDMSEQEKKLLEKWLARSEKNQKIYDELKQGWGEIFDLAQYDTDENWNKFKQTYSELFDKEYTQKKNLPYLMRACQVFIMAASIVAILLSDLLYNKREEDFLTLNKVAIRFANDSLFAPGTIPLQRVEGNYISSICKDSILYKRRVDDPGCSAELVFNHVYTSAGGQYTVVLPDESKITLNAGSSIRFPVHGDPFYRKVEITGEAYFDVKKVPSGKAYMPFIVQVKTSTGLKQRIEVTGTRFNVNAYCDEPVIKTSLLEGNVRVTSNGKSAVLKPGEQLKVTTDSLLKSGQMNANDVIAWRDNYFVFENTSIHIVVKELSRWYGVQIVFEGDATGKVYMKLNRSTACMDVVRRLAELLNYQVKMESGKIRLIANQ